MLLLLLFLWVNIKTFLQYKLILRLGKHCKHCKHCKVYTLGAHILGTPSNCPVDSTVVHLVHWLAGSTTSHRD